MIKKSLICILLAFSILSSFCVYSEPEQNAEQTENSEATETVSGPDVKQPEDTEKNISEEKEEKKEIPSIVFSEAVTPIILDSSKLNPPSVSAAAAVVMDAKSGTIIYTKNEHEKMFPASTTKIMTAIIALESGRNLDEVFTADIKALAPITTEDSHMGLLVGEQVTLRTLIEGMLIASANDAANVIAIEIAGSIGAFADLMNQKAQSLGAYDTHFANANGMHDDNHYTSAYDLSIMAQYAMENETFREIVKQSTFKFPVTNKHSQEQMLSSTNLFLSRARSSKHIWEPVIGIKTGFTSLAGYCLVTAAVNGSSELISVVMNCPNTDNENGALSYIDSKSLLNFGFNNYASTTLAKSGDIIRSSKVYEALHDARVSMTVENDITSLLPKTIDIEKDVIVEYEIPDKFDAPIKKGDALGTVSYNYQDTEIAYATLVAANDVELNTVLFMFHTIIKIITNPFLFVPLLLFLIILIVRRRNLKKRDKKLKNMRRKNRKKTTDESMKKKYMEYTETGNPNSRYR